VTFKTARILILIPCLVSLLGCDNEPSPLKVDLTEIATEAELKHTKPGDLYRFGFDLRSSPQEDSRQYQSLLTYLHKKTGLQFSLAFVRTDLPVYEQLAVGSIDFAAAGGVTIVKSMFNGAGFPIAQGVARTGKTTYQAAIIVSPDSPIKSLHDLKGKKMAFGNENSTQGHLLPRIMLENSGIDLTQLGGYSYTGSHQRCADSVIAKAGDACGLQDIMAEDLARQGKVRIVALSDEFPSSGIVAANRIPPSVREQIQQALLEFRPLGEDADALYHWEKTEMANGFSNVTPETYRPIEAGMRKLGMLKE